MGTWANHVKRAGNAYQQTMNVHAQNVVECQKGRLKISSVKRGLVKVFMTCASRDMLGAVEFAILSGGQGF